MVSSSGIIKWLDEYFNQTIQTILVKYCHSNTSKHNHPFSTFFFLGRRAVYPIDKDVCHDSDVKALTRVNNDPEYDEGSEERS